MQRLHGVIVILFLSGAGAVSGIVESRNRGITQRHDTKRPHGSGANSAVRGREVDGEIRKETTARATSDSGNLEPHTA